jgi:hypothetical protein|tara:strand:+ start:1979 stop:2713 length:735 start_codon:yes stop_codon:yes gene_type:complete
VGFSSLAAREFVALSSRDRRSASTAIKECATMLDLKEVDGKEKKEQTLLSPDGASRTSSAKSNTSDTSKPSSVAQEPTVGKRKGKGRRSGSNSSLKTAGSEKIGAEFWDEVGYLLRIASPSYCCRFNQLLAAQFSLLVMRTLLTVRANKVNTFYLTRAISTASWKFWTRWFFNFGGWMGSAVVVNSGLRYTETLIQIELRNALTKQAHRKVRVAFTKSRRLFPVLYGVQSESTTHSYTLSNPTL